MGDKLLHADPPSDLYERMTELAASVPAGSDGLRCEPFFTGSRTDPALRASFSGISPDNFTPAHFARALLEGMVSGFYAFFEQMKPVVGTRPLLVGAGNGVRHNSLLARMLARRFGKPLLIPATRKRRRSARQLPPRSDWGCSPIWTQPRPRCSTTLTQ